jgi:hypothetical protein
MDQSGWVDYTIETLETEISKTTGNRYASGQWPFPFRGLRLHTYRQSL